ncbi:TldD/PmbA family protein [cf. Phormidesmis sp. LEGE 11477]|uniref:TldD/PmbA family protein n=1 Tax=cf. Phormidesmis sp. LEGE 11477 TaxID=1828680 RepID=UPI0018826C8F|nr:TldD/PmbA family protein [cf. Phormidesmis sp. LEGE 11477]MBE9061620.1 TldD/PmbA family protein [cf. Phormidesmis sp. LEGE 11477]
MIGHLTAILEQIDISADWIGIRATQTTSTTRSMRDGNPQQNGRALNRGAMVEVLADGQFGYSATNQITPEALRIAAQQAYDQAIAASQWAVHPFTAAVRPTVVGSYTSPLDQPFDSLTAAEINDLLRQLCERLKVSADIVRTSAIARTHDIESWLVSSNGSQVHQKLNLIEGHLGAIAQAAGVTQARTDNGHMAHSYQGGWERFKTADLWERATRTGEQAVELLSAPDCPNDTTTLVLAPDQMMLQLHESVGHPLELDRILGDERNYAGGSFVRPQDFGQLAYGSPLMNVTFDATHPGEIASYDYDDTGTPAQREYLIRQGILQRGLGGLESQRRLNSPGVACARACNWNRPAIDRMANINLESGETSFENMISSIENGVYMESNRSWSIDDQRRKFQFGCEYARKIENGKLTTPLKNPNYRATTPQFWHSLSQVGDASTMAVYGTPYCGKGEPNQLVRVGHASPVCTFDNIEVFGGAGA